MPSQSARSRALASAVESPTTRTDFEVCDEIKLVLDTMTSRTGPLSSPVESNIKQNARKTVIKPFYKLEIMY